MTKSEKELISHLIKKMVKTVNQLNWVSSLGEVSIFNGIKYDVIKSQSLINAKETIHAFVDLKSGQMYRAVDGAIDKRICLNILECQNGDLIRFVFPILEFNPN